MVDQGGKELSATVSPWGDVDNMLDLDILQKIASHKHLDLAPARRIPVGAPIVGLMQARPLQLNGF